MSEKFGCGDWLGCVSRDQEEVVRVDLEGKLWDVKIWRIFLSLKGDIFGFEPKIEA